MRVGHATVGRFTFVCGDCSAWLLQSELGTDLCCKHGRVQLADARDPPELLQRLLTADTTEARKFRERTRSYNNALAMGSLHADNEFRPLSGVYEVSINGQVYAQIGDLRAPGKLPETFAQYYVIDNRDLGITGRVDEAQRRAQVDLDPQIVGALHDMLCKENDLVRRFRTAGDRMRRHPQMYFRLALTTANNKDRRAWNEYGPVENVNEIGVLIPDCDDTSSLQGRRPIVLEALSSERGQLQHIPADHELYEPLLFPLLFPHGERGWRWGIRPREGARTHGYGWHPNTNVGRTEQISMRDFIVYRMQMRSSRPYLWLARRLSQLIAVDSWLRVENYKLDW